VSWLNVPCGKKVGRLPVRVTGHNAVLPGRGRRERRNLRDLHGHHHLSRSPGRARGRGTGGLPTRWGAPETVFGRDKTAIAGAGNRTSGPVLPPRLAVQQARAWLAATRLVRAGAAAVLRGGHAVRALRRKDAVPVTADGVGVRAHVHDQVRANVHGIMLTGTA
jgi:hypothetical protein